ncbi:MAG: tRNA dihydrouridine synthase DusB [Nitrospinae bacterium]|nr:tRNA dihydrouridine synthase DusB [Nitrospinota bacterium]
MNIGVVEIKSPAVMAPIAGMTDQPYRRIVMEYGAGLVTTELLSANALVRDSAKTFSMFPADNEPRPVAVQLFGGDREVMRDACAIVDQHANCDIIDLNFGCPVKKVTRCGAGAALLKDVENAGKLVEAVVGAVKKPVTVKIRAGWDFSSVNALDMAMAIEQAGAVAVAVHARTASQMYSGEADWGVIAKVADALKIPVIGNGDIDTPEKALQRLSASGCKFIMIGRGALGAPWIFRQINQLSATGHYAKPGLDEISSTILRHLKDMVALYGDVSGIKRMRAHFGYYARGFRLASQFRREINAEPRLEGLERLIREYFSVESGAAA